MEESEKVETSSGIAKLPGLLNNILSIIENCQLLKFFLSTIFIQPNFLNLTSVKHDCNKMNFYSPN